MRGSGRYKCLTCGNILNELWRFKNHIRLCFMPSDSNIEENYEEVSKNVKLKQFKAQLEARSSSLVCKLSANLNLSRKIVFEIIGDFKKYLSLVADGLTTVIAPITAIEHTNITHEFGVACKNAFKTSNTEHKLGEKLIADGLLEVLPYHLTQ